MNLFRLCLAVTVVGMVRAEDTFCKIGQGMYNQSCYQLLPGDSMNFADARAGCYALGLGLGLGPGQGGEIAAPDSPEEHQFVWETYTGNGSSRDVWIGCSKARTEGRYVKSTGNSSEECSYIKWKGGSPLTRSPSRDEAKDCVSLQWDAGGFASVDYCSNKRQVVCQVPPYGVPTVSCLREYSGPDSGGPFTARCRASRLMAHGLRNAIAATYDAVCRPEPLCLGIDVSQGVIFDYEILCQLTANNQTCQYVFM